MKLSNLFRQYSHQLKIILFFVPGIFLLQVSGNAQSISPDYVYTSAREFGISSNTIPGFSTVDVFHVRKLENKMAERKAFKTTLCLTKNERQVELYFFPGTSDKKALIVGGAHGSELSSIELAYHVIEQLSRDEKPFYTVMVIPSLFPDNAAKAILEHSSHELKGRYSSENSVDPNRQMPALGKPFDPDFPSDHHGRPIEIENQYLLYLIQQYKPERIANLHAIRDPQKAGIFADPRTDHNGLALGFSADSLLAAAMNRIVCTEGGKIGSPSVDSLVVIYHKDPQPVPPGFIQPRNVRGSDLPQNRGNGISLGSWATTAIQDDDPFFQREASTLLTIEFPGYKSSVFLHNEQKFNYLLNLRLYSLALTSIFLHR